MIVARVLRTSAARLAHRQPPVPAAAAAPTRPVATMPRKAAKPPPAKPGRSTASAAAAALGRTKKQPTAPNLAAPVERGLAPHADGQRRCWPNAAPPAAPGPDEGGEKAPSKVERTRAAAKAATHARMLAYHDARWGRPITDPHELFGQMVLQSMQSGLSWTTILNKEDNFRRAFAGYDIRKVARFKAGDVERLMSDAGIVRNRAKILAAIANAKVAVRLETEHRPGGFAAWLWQWAPRRAEERWQVECTRDGSHMRSEFKVKSRDRLRADGVHPTAAVAAAAAALKQEGFRWLGETVLLSFFQAAGMVNHHSADCFAFQEAEEEYVRALEGLGLSSGGAGAAAAGSPGHTEPGSDGGGRADGVGETTAAAATGRKAKTPRSNSNVATVDKAVAKKPAPRKRRK